VVVPFHTIGQQRQQPSRLGRVDEDVEVDVDGAASALGAEGEGQRAAERVPDAVLVEPFGQLEDAIDDGARRRRPAGTSGADR
jgi:hypothetical protein